MQRRVLAVDDSSSIRKLVEFSLKSKGFEVDTSADGQEGLEFLAKETYHAIILDINMPRVDGFEFLARIKKDPTYSHIPVIILTTEGQEEDKNRALQMGAAEYLIKPFRPSELIEVMGRILSQRD